MVDIKIVQAQWTQALEIEGEESKKAFPGVCSQPE